ncbi:MAG TPA: NAD+ synthase [Burkholderiales bacterium]|nr:NAD+ synthase [Burkholderiales bacterium]
MPRTLRVALAQLNLLVGDVAGNVQRMVSVAQRARDEMKADLVVFPELALMSYPPEDLLLRPELTMHVETGLGEMLSRLTGIDVVVGYPKRQYGRLYNAASLLRDGRVEATYFKHCLPNYSVFDEKRYFAEGKGHCIVNVKGLDVGLTICEDVWGGWPIDEVAAAGAKFVLNINASPFHLNKHQERLDVVARAARRNRVPIAYVNLVGGQDELVFDGDSFVVDADGAVTHRARCFEEDMIVIDVAIPNGAPAPGTILPALSEEQSAYAALVLGVRDYIEKNRFPGVVIGLSGGIDSALTLCIAVDAIGAERVQAVSMPSRYTADMSIEDAQAQAKVLGVAFSVIPIEPMFEAFLGALKTEFKDLAPDVTEENLQARVRGTTLMAISNKTRRIVLTTGNKSEMSVGYATLYGDMAGGFAAIKDVLKTLVYRLAEYRNSAAQGSANVAGGRMPGATIAPVIPRRVFERPPSAELRPDQKDADSLPPYETLDPILQRYVEDDESVATIVKAGFDEATVRKVVAMVDRNEYKRRQAPPGVRITPRAFGRDRRYPITSGFKPG